MSTDSTGRQERLEQAIARFLEAAEAGAPPDRDAFVDAHPEVADELREFFLGHDALRPAAGGPARPLAALPDSITRADAVDQATLPLTAGSAPPAPSRVGYFGDYELLTEIARGGMGVVYKARQINLDRVVALKMILAGRFASPDDVRRFQQEAEAAANLEHPGIVPIYEIGQHEGQHFFSMSYVDGPSLAEVVADGPLPPRMAAAVVQQIAEAIAYAHSQGVLHRDLKPANVLLAPLDARSAARDGRAVTLPATSQHPHRAVSYQPKLTDFGLAKRTQVDSGLTGTGQIIGTPSYMPPEQAAAQTQQIGPAADVYSIGAILYCLLTGRPPFQAATVVDTLLQVLEQEPVSPRELDRQVPKDLATIVLKCLRKNPHKRYGSAQALADDLRRWLSSIPILARPVGPVERTTKWVRRHPATTVLMLAIAASLLVGTVVSWRFAVLAQQHAQQAERSAAETRQERDRYRDQLWQSMLQQGRAERLAGGRWESLRVLGQAADIKRTPTLRSEAIQTIASAGVRLLHAIPIGTVGAVDISDDGKQVAISGQYALGNSDWDYSVAVWDLASGKQIASTGTNRGYDTDAVRFRPGSHQVLLSQNRSNENQIVLWDPASAPDGQSSATPAAMPGDAEFVSQTRFSADGELIALGAGGQMLVCRVADGTEMARLAGALPIAFLSNQVLLIKRQEQLQRWNFASGQQPSALPEGNQLLDLARRAPIAVVADHDTLQVWDVDAGSLLATLKEHPQVNKARISPDGRLVALQTSSDRDTLHVWDWRTDSFKRPLTGVIGIYADAFEQAAFDPQGALLAAQAGNNSVKIWNVETGEVLASMPGTFAPLWSSDGRLLATIAAGTVRTGEGTSSGSDRSLVKVWQVAFPARTYVKGISGVVESIEFNSSGSQLVTDGSLWDVADASDGLAMQLATQQLGGSFDDAGNVWQVRWGSQPKPNRKSGIPHLTVTVATTSPDVSDIEFTVPGTRVQHAVSPDGRSIALASDAYRWAGKAKHPGYAFALELRELHGNRLRWRQTERNNTTPFTCLRFSSNGRLLATGKQNVGIELWDVSSGEKLGDASFGVSNTPGGSDSPSCLRFSSDGSRLFASNDDRGDIMMVDVASGRRLIQWAGHPGGALALAVHPQGTLLASAGSDRMIRLWSTSSQQELASWQGHDDRVTALAFHPDGRSLVSGSADATLKVWNLASMQKELADLDLQW